MWYVLSLLKHYIKTIEEVKAILADWRSMAALLPEPLRDQAISSIQHKSFHCYGGAVFALYPHADKERVLRLIVALQTISDYLDNLCDRLDVNAVESYRVLHESFLDALTCDAPLKNYYRLYPYAENIYLPQLVQACQSELQHLPSYQYHQHSAYLLATHYCNLQTYKHGSGPRVKRLQQWTTTAFDDSLAWNEWAAASGSTLGIFLIFAVSSIQDKIDLEQEKATYFPWIQGLHILLDYLIDREEDLKHGDLNFTTYFDSAVALEDGLIRFAHEGRKRSKKLTNSHFHRTVIDGLVALYGSDAKVNQQKLQNIIKKLGQGYRSPLMLATCRLLRSIGYI